MAPYTYQPLDLDGLAIRLLRLIKGKAEDIIQCEIFEAWIDEFDGTFPYEALSYTWGSKEKEASIVVNDSTLPVTLNLFIALEHLRSENEDRILWIDAICIDQECEQERNHQVRYMGNIYKQAEQVIIWLGEGTEDTDLIMDTMKRLQENNVHVMGNWRKSALLWMHSHAGVGDMTAQQHELQQGMKLLLARPWFQRVWILQEVANARVAIILCGSKTVSARIFAQVPALIELTPEPHCQAILDIMPGLSRRESWWGQDRHLHTLLRKFRESKATDDRDIVFALLGISSDTDGLLFPDYKKSLQQVIHDTISFLLFDKSPGRLASGFPDWTLLEFLQNLDSLSGAVLKSASRSGNCEIVRVILESGEVNIDSRDTKGRTPLSWAAERGDELTVSLLLSQGAEVNLKDLSHGTPLFYALSNDHIDIMALLIGQGAEVNFKDITGRTPLSWAVERENEAAVTLLLAHGAVTDPNSYKAPPFDEGDETSVLRNDYGNLFDNFDTTLENYAERPGSNVATLKDDLVSSASFKERSGHQSVRLFGQFQGEATIVERITVPFQVWIESGTLLGMHPSHHFESFSKLVMGDAGEFLQYKACNREKRADSVSFRILYSFPKFANDSCDPVTLETLMESSESIPPLGQRLHVAQLLSTAVLRIHSNSYLHKFIRPQNILFFTPKRTTINNGQPENLDLDRPFIAGLKLLPIVTERNPDLFVKEYGELLCQHPQQRRQTRGTTYLFRPEYDIYSFGCLLFNLAMWHPVSNPLFGWAPLEEVTKARRKILNDRVGNIYVDAMFWCLGLAPGSPILSPPQGRSSQEELTSLTSGFHQNVVLELEKCSA